MAQARDRCNCGVACPYSLLVFLNHLKAAFRQHLYRLLKEQDWPVGPRSQDRREDLRALA